MAILMKHMQEEPISPARLNPGISPALSQVILKSIAKAPHERFRSASAMTIAIAEALSMPVPAELLQPKAMLPAENSTGILLSPPSAASMPVTDSSLPTYIPPPQMLLTPDPVATARTAPRQDTPITLVPPAEKLPARKRSIPLLLLALLIAAIAASGLFFALHRTTPPAAPSQVVAGQIRFLSSPTAPSGTIDEVEVTLNALPDAPAGEQYYAWLQINNENLFPIHWLITTTNGHLSSPTYRNSSLLANKPYLFLITLEKAHSNPQIANLASQARLYYALLPSSIQNQAAFAIHACPQGNNNTVCMS